jgi:hypothetical protein
MTIQDSYGFGRAIFKEVSMQQMSGHKVSYLVTYYFIQLLNNYFEPKEIKCQFI